MSIAEITSDILHQEYVVTFPNSTTRPSIYAGWQRYIKEFSSEVCPGFKQWIGGSFVTKKESPGDIDVVNFIPSTHFTSAANRFDEAYGSKKEFMVDGRTVPVYAEGDPMRLLTEMRTMHWQKFFSEDKQGNKQHIFSIEHADVNS